jgi:penicillin G amidase
MRSSSLIVAAAWYSGALLCGCGSTSGGVTPSLTLTPSGTSGTLSITAPTDFTAQLVGSTADVAWTATGGTLTAMAGLHVVYVPPPGTATGMLTATAGNLTASVMISSAPAALAPKSIPGLKGAVTVQYDAQDVPHIQCTQAVDCIAVQGYLQARDRWFPMDFLRHVAEGHLAELIGPDGLSSDVQLRTLFTTRDGQRLESALKAAAQADPDPAHKTFDLLTAYTAGVNAYINELKAGTGVLPGEYRQLPFALTPADIDPWRIEDTLAIGRLNQFQLSETLNAELDNGKFLAMYGPAALGGKQPDPGKMLAWVRAPSPPTERGHTLSATASQPPTQTSHASHASVVSPRSRRRAAKFDPSPWRDALASAAARMAELHDRLRPADASIGSNNWVVSAAKSATGVAMVANDPHLSLQYPPLFHLAAMTSSTSTDHLNLTGGSFPGVPGALVGRGEHVGWGVTVVGYDVTDVYLEQFTPCPGGQPTDPPCVVFNSAPNHLVQTKPFPQSYKVRIGPGAAGLVDSSVLPLPPSAVPPPVVLIVPHHGPVIQAPDPKTGKGLSVRWTGHEGNTLDSKAFYGLNTATDVDAAMLALKDYATGAQNFVLADDQGNIAYDPHALVPLRPWAVKGVPAAPWFPLPGDGSTEWGPPGVDCVTPGAVDPTCWIPDAQLPQGKNPAKGYFFTANADPTGVSDNNDNDPRPDPAVSTDPPYLSFNWDDSTGFRATRIEQMLQAAIDAHGKVSLDDMMKIQSDHVSRLGLAFAPFIPATPPDGTSPVYAVAQPIIAQWLANGADCPSGVTGSDPKLSAADPNPAVVQNSSGCFLFHEFLRAVVTNVFTDDLAVAGQGVNSLAAIKALLFMLGLDPADPGTSFCNDVDPRTGQRMATKSCAKQVADALVQAFNTLSGLLGKPDNWVWGRVHTITPVSLLALVTNGYAPGPFARPGGAFTVDVGSPSLSGAGLDFSYGSGGNVRHISLMDPDPTKSVVKMQLPGPERDGPVVTSAPDLLGQWVKNSYFDYAAGDQIKAAAVTTQTFQAP